jgi:hypothetical protein
MVKQAENHILLDKIHETDSLYRINGKTTEGFIQDGGSKVKTTTALIKNVL